MNSSWNTEEKDAWTRIFKLDDNTYFTLLGVLVGLFFALIIDVVKIFIEFWFKFFPKCIVDFCDDDTISKWYIVMLLWSILTIIPIVWYGLFEKRNKLQLSWIEYFFITWWLLLSTFMIIKVNSLLQPMEQTYFTGVLGELIIAFFLFLFIFVNTIKLLSFLLNQ